MRPLSDESSEAWTMGITQRTNHKAALSKGVAMAPDERHPA